MIDMKRKSKMQAVVRALIRSRFYFDLSLRERHETIDDILRKFPTAVGKSVPLPEKHLFFKRER